MNISVEDSRPICPLTPLRIGDHVRWDRDEKYGGPLTFSITAVRPKRFDAGGYTFRRRDGRVVGLTFMSFFVVDVTMRRVPDSRDDYHPQPYMGGSAS